MDTSIYHLISRANAKVYRGTHKYYFPCEKIDLQSLVNEAITLKSEESIHRLCVKVRQHYGFDYFNFLVFFPTVSGVPLTYFMLDYSNEWTRYYEENDLLLLDLRVPVTLTRITPTFWGHGDICRSFNSKLNTLCNDKQQAVLNLAYDFGLKRLTSFPVFGTGGDCGILRLAHEEKGSPLHNQSDVNQYIADVNLLTNYIYEALIRVINQTYSAQICTIDLTTREKEILKWVASGKSNTSIGDILQISENTVAKHMKNIHKKLGVNSRQHAVARAISSNLICV